MSSIIPYQAVAISIDQPTNHLPKSTIEVKRPIQGPVSPTQILLFPSFAQATLHLNGQVQFEFGSEPSAVNNRSWTIAAPAGIHTAAQIQAHHKKMRATVEQIAQETREFAEIEFRRRMNKAMAVEVKASSSTPPTTTARAAPLATPLPILRDESKVSETKSYPLAFCEISSDLYPMLEVTPLDEPVLRSMTASAVLLYIYHQLINNPEMQKSNPGIDSIQINLMFSGKPIGKLVDGRASDSFPNLTIDKIVGSGATNHLPRIMFSPPLMVVG